MSLTVKYIIISFLLVFSVSSLWSQNFIDLDEPGVRELMKSSYPQFKQDRNVVNDAYEYLKFIDKITEQTILFFMSDEGKCTYVRWISDYSNLNDMLALLNRNYKKTGNNSWTYSERNQNYIINLEEGEWYFTVSFRKK